MFLIYIGEERIMNKEEFDEYIKSRYEPRVEWYDKKAVLYKKLTYLIQIPLIVIAATVPILAAFKYTLLTVIFSVTVSAGIGILKFGKFEYLWHNYRTTCEMLQREKIYYDLQIDVYEKAEDPEKLFIQRVEKILSIEHVRWDSSHNGHFLYIS